MNGQQTNQQDKKKPCNIHVHWYCGSIHGQYTYLVVVIVDDDGGVVVRMTLAYYCCDYSQETAKS